MKGLKCNILTPTGIIHGHLEIQGEKIHRILTDGACDGVAFDEEVIVVPGFIDQHIHGVNRSDAMDGTMEDLRNMAMSLLERRDNELSSDDDDTIRGKHSQGFKAH